jgi:signal transduction histidine kinase
MSFLPSELRVNAVGGTWNIAAWWRLVHAMGIARLAWIACSLSIAVLGSAALLVHRADQRGVNNALDANVSLNAKGYAKFVMFNLAIVDRQLTVLRKQHLQGLRLPAQAAMNSQLQELNGMVLQVTVANVEGQVVDTSLGMPGMPVSIADQVHFQVFKNNSEDRLFISEPVRGRVPNKLSLQLVRPMLDPDGKFMGVIVASIDPELLKNFFTDLKALTHQGRLSIIGLDGIVRFRLTNQGFSAGQDAQASPNWKQVSTLPAGIYDEPDLGDGIYRRIGFHRVEGYPLLVTVGTGLHEQLQNFNSRWNLILSLALALAVVLTVVATTIARLAKKQKRYLDLLEENRLRALEGNQIKSNFLASLSHELRTPLNSILGFSELIRDTSPEPRIIQYAGLIHKSGTHLNALVNTILDLTKIESGKMGLTLEPVQIPELMEMLITIHKVNADEKNVELSLSINGVVQNTVQSDRAKLVQVMNNVIHNAIKFTPTGSILIMVKPAGNEGLLISVIDTGIGVASDKTSQVFERFNTVDAQAFSSCLKGFGLGLALCKELLHLLHGKITLTSNVAYGTTVDIFIPYSVPAERKPA